MRGRIPMRCPTLSELPPPPPGRTGWPWTEESHQLPDTMPDGRPWPRVSIVTPSYNQAQFIEETIRSVLLQGYPDLEYIIIDGGSTDGSVEIIRKYEKWLAYWVSEKDRGQSHAINKGFERATGEIVAWLNSDDIYQPDTLQDVALNFTTYSECGLLYADSCFINEHSQVIEPIETQQYDLATLVLSHAYLPQQSTFLRASVLAEQGLLDEELHYVMDFDLWLRVITVYPYRRVAGIWSGFRRSAMNKTMTQNLRFWPEIARVLEKPCWIGRIPTELYRRALEEARFIGGLHLVCANELEAGMALIEKSFAGQCYPFGGMLNCIYITIDNLKRHMSITHIEDLFEKMLCFSKNHDNRKFCNYIISARMFYSYSKGDLVESRKWGLSALLSSSDFRHNSKLMSVFLKSLLGPRLLRFGRKLRRYRYAPIIANI